MATAVFDSAWGMTAPITVGIGRGVSSTLDPEILRLAVASGSLPETQLEPSRVFVEGEPFAIEREDAQFFLTHPQWSLMGVGATLEEANSNLLAEGRTLARLLAADDVNALSAEARRLREYVLRLG